MFNIQVVDYNGILDYLKVNLLSANTTTATYDLSDDLPKRVQYVLREDLDIVPQFKPRYPLVSLMLDNKSDEVMRDIAGGRFNKEIDLSFKITCVYDSFSNADDNLWTLVRNVETNLRNNVANNNYNENGFKFIYLIPMTARPITHDGGKSPFNKSAEISVLVKGHLKDV